MSSKNKGRQVYCIVTDAYGKSVKTKTATLSLGKNLKITKQPTSTKLPSGATAKISFTASGDGLTYKWYYKDAGKSKFSLTKSFKGNSYSLKMSSKNKGRQVYCVVTDAYGKSVKTDVVTLSLGKTVAVTKQPTNTVAHVGYTAAVKLEAYGDGLTYKWYYKDAGESKFSLTNTFKGNSYSIEMNSECDGRQVYCVVTDAYGKTIQTNTVTLKSAHEMGEYKTYIEATVDETGIERSTCAKCSYYKDRTIPNLKAVHFITINADNGQEPYIVGVAENGKYSLKIPKKIGYTFAAFKDAKGNDFALTGNIFNDIEITAVWTLDGTDTLNELIERTEAGVDKIKITSDIVVNTPLFVNHDTTIYSDADHSIIRDPLYDGDIFVVGKNKDGESGIWEGLEPKLTLGGGEGTLTIDGNKDNVEVTVVGSSVFVSESSTLNLYDGICIANNKKLGNKRGYELDDQGEPTYSTKRIGGAAIVVLDSTVNMYGGVIENNEVATEYTIEPDEQGVDQSMEYNACGGAVYNRGNFNMYGGVIRGNLGLRGGAFYNDRMAYLFAGEISENTATVYGGAISSSSSMNSDLFIGREEGEGRFVIKDNLSLRAGGALYSNTSSPIVIFGNTDFIGNRSESSGGAIYTAGGLTVSGTVFDGNSCYYSGGSIYHHYTKAEFKRREVSISDCEFKNNKANLGGAIILSNSGTVTEENKDGTLAYISDCTFIKNEANNYTTGEGETLKTNYGNGGAIYITRMSDSTITNCTFSENSADNNAGAISMHSEATVIIEDCSFAKNSAVQGGAAYASSGADLCLKNVQFTANRANFTEANSGGNGGAVFIAEGITTKATIKFDNVDFTENHADGNAGAIYQNACEINMDSSCEFDGNTALGHGGAIYLTYKKLADEAQTKVGSIFNANGVTFKNNVAAAGGAISIRSACEANLDGVVFLNNQATGEGEDSLGGGAIYVGFGKLSLTDVTAKENVSVGHGGVVNALASTVTVKNTTFEANSAMSGGVINATSQTELTVTATEFKDNQSTYDNLECNSNFGGGAINTASSTLAVSDCTFDGNSTGYYGGAILSSKTQVTIDQNTVVKNSVGATGAALYFRNGSSVILKDISILDNQSNGNGVVYVNGSTMKVENVAATGNSANSGGVIFASGLTTVVDVVDSNMSQNTAKLGGVIHVTDGTINLSRSEFKLNTANNGGAVYAKKGTVDVKDVIFEENKSERNSSNTDGHGGAISIIGGTITTDSETEFNRNSAENHAGAIYVSYATNEDEAKTRTPGTAVINGSKFVENSALGGGAISVRSGCEATLNDCSLTSNSVEGFEAGTDGTGENDGDMEGGGAVYVGYGKVTLNNVTATLNTASDFGGVIDSVTSTVIINGGTYSQNTSLNGGAIYGIGNTVLEITGAEFTENSANYDPNVGVYDFKFGGGAINLYKGEITINSSIFDKNTSKYYGGAVLVNNATVSISEQTIFKNSQGATGAALYVKSAPSASIVNTTFENNTSVANGVVYLAGGTYELEGVTAKNNKANNGGVIYTSSTSTVVNLENCTFEENSASSGGVLYTDSANINFIGGTISNNSASNGGVVYSKNGKVSLENTNVTLNSVTSAGGAINSLEGTLTIKGATFENNTAKGNGGAVYAKQTETQISDTTFNQNSAQSNGGAIDIVGCQAEINGNTIFTNNTATKHGGAVYVVYDKIEVEEEGTTKTKTIPSILQMTNGLFKGNSALGGGAVSIRTSCEATFNGTEFKENSVEGFEAGADGTGVNDGDMEGGGAIYVGYGKVTLNDVTATLNTASDFGGVVDSVKSTVNINGGNYTANKTNSGGVVYAITTSVVNVTDALLAENESVYYSSEPNSAIGGGAICVKNSTLNIKGTTLDKNKTGYYAGAVHATKSTVTISDDSVISANSGATGAALYFIDSCTTTIENSTVKDNVSHGNGTIYQNTGKITLNNVTATNNQAVNGGVLFVSNGSTVLNIDKSIFTENTATSTGGAIDFANGTAYVTDSEFNLNTAQLGGAVFADLGTFNVSGTKFTNNSAVKNSSGSNGNGGAISIVGAKVIGTDGETEKNIFSENTAENHGGAVYVSYKTNADSTKSGGTLEMTGGLFEGNSAVAGGAISARTSATVNLNGTELKNNEATGSKNNEGGGAIFANNNTVSLSGVILDGNKSPYYGGAVTALGCDFTINNKSQVKNNIGITGVAFNFREGGTSVIDDVSVTDNAATANGSGVIYITGNGTMSITSLTASKNSNNNGAVIYISGSAKVTIADSNISGNTAKSFGGAIYHASSKAIDIENTVIENNTAKNGGAIFAAGTGIITIKDSTIKGNSATEKGGAINAGNKETPENAPVVYRPANIVINNTLIEGNTSVKGGGAINVDYGSVVEIIGSQIKSNTTSGGDGGAIYVADSSTEGTLATTLKADSTTFEGNSASAKGGAISTDTTSTNLVIDVTSCTFSKNSSVSAGGGAVEIQNGNQTTADDPETIAITFKDCIFTENQAKTTGGAIEIRTSSCAKIDGITATKNVATSNAGVIYITSNFSRLYLTGEVTLSENSSASGTFAYLYNNKYTNPPKIYTTHSNTASWVSEVKGNTSSIAFDLEILP